MGFLLMIIICYLIGSIPCGYLIGKRNNIDIRRYGSGNIGAKLFVGYRNSLTIRPM
jgi:glycerol-3-phosphate acyltransferase PlsY